MGEGGGGEEKGSNTITRARPDRKVTFILGELFDT